MKLTVKQLEHATLLAATGNFTRAAERANLSQSAFSRSIDALESSLDVRLFDRERGAVAPTIFGEVLVSGALEVLVRIDEIYREVSHVHGLTTGSLAVAFGLYPAEIVGHRAVGEILRKHPQLSVRTFVCNWEDVNRIVLGREVDLAYVVLSAARDEPFLEVEPVVRHEKAIYARANHPLAGIPGITREQLDAYPLVSIRVPAEFAAHVPGRSVLDASSGNQLPAVEIDDFTVARGIIAASDGIGVTTPLQIEPQLSSGELVLLDYDRPWIAPEYGFIYRKNRSLSPAAREFMKVVRETETAAVTKNSQLMDQYHPRSR